VAFSPNGNYLVVTHQNGTWLKMYKRDGDTFTIIDNPAIGPTGNCYGATFSSDGGYLVLANNTTPFLTIYKVEPPV
jgi:6-phosphogluconolactonase (cycloisomerase 2 family)